MKEVFVVKFSVDYEGTYLEGVFSTQEKAREFVENHIKETYGKFEQWIPDQEGCWRRNDLAFTIVGYEVDSRWV